MDDDNEDGFNDLLNTTEDNYYTFLNVSSEVSGPQT